QRRAARTRDVDAVEQHGAARGLDEAVDAAEERRLPRAGEADEHDELTALDVERDPVERTRAARIDLGDVLQGEDRRHRVSVRRTTRPPVSRRPCCYRACLSAKEPSSVTARALRASAWPSRDPRRRPPRARRP